MRKQFAAYYELPESRIKDIWKNALIVFDTNALLNLYRYKEETRNQFIKVIEFYGDRLWLPYQVGMEYHNRREVVIAETAKVYESFEKDLINTIDNAVNQVLEHYSNMEHIEETEIRKIINRSKVSISKKLKKQEKEHPDFISEDVVLDTITRLYDNKIGIDLSLEELNDIYAEGDIRYAHKVPPGYADAKDKAKFGRRAKFGDLILWKQVLRKSKENNKDVIFVTNDQKEDWYANNEGRHTPRKELIQEFLDFTGRNILIYKSSLFLKYAKQNKELTISPKTINEVEKVSDENKYWSFNNLYKIPSLQEAMESISTISSMQESFKSISENYGSISQLFEKTKFNYWDDLRQSFETPNLYIDTPNLGKITSVLGDSLLTEPMTRLSVFEQNKHNKGNEKL